MAEEAGWDGLFLWDHLGWVLGFPGGDPWTSLAAAAMVTERIKLGTAVTALPRRRPQVVATQVTALDRLSGGRFVFGVGLGGTRDEYELFGEPADDRLRAAKLDEGLSLLAQLWAGGRVDHRGEHYQVRGATLAPPPLQQPRPPIWVGGSCRAALERAGRWDGYIVGTANELGEVTVPPEEIGDGVSIIGRRDAFEVAVCGVSPPGGSELRTEYVEAGATWWLESIHDLRGSADAMVERISRGP